MTTERERAFEAEVVRINRRYATEVVAAFEFCPFARHALATDAVVNVVLLGREPSVEATVGAIDRLCEMPASVEIAQLIYPEIALGPREFEWFQAEVRKAEEARRPGLPVFVSAAFHPRYELDRATPDRLVPFLRRTPDPTLQMLRYARLREIRDESARGTAFVDIRKIKLEELLGPPKPADLTDRIAHDNLATLERVGAERIEAIYADIAEDRARSYARFA
jgi:hypothetical protein